MSTDPGPFEKVYDAHVVGIYRFVYARVGNHPDAEDLTAQVFVRAVEQLDTDREPGQIAAWLYRVVADPGIDEPIDADDVRVVDLLERTRIGGHLTDAVRARLRPRA